MATNVGFYLFFFVITDDECYRFIYFVLCVHIQVLGGYIISYIVFFRDIKVHGKENKKKNN